MSDKDSKKNKRGSELESLLHSEHLVSVEKMAVGGSAVARLSVNEKLIVVFIPYGAPDDQLKIKITAIEKNFLKGEIIEVLSAGKSRQTPVCQYFGRCGGCLWQHIDYDTQILQKELILRDLFKKFLPSVEYVLSDSISTSEKLGYRNRIQLKQIGKKIGYFKHESHDIVEIDNCLIAETEIQNYIPLLKQKIRDSEKLKKFEIKINQSNQVEHYPVGEFGEGLAFSQVNRFVNQKLIETVVRLVKQISPLKITELYAGAGNFTFPIAESLPQTTIDAVELSSELTKNAVERLKAEKKHKQIIFFTTKSEIFCTTSHRLSTDFVLLDPPRSGCHSDVILTLAEQKPSTILYISCHPVNLVRDLQGLSPFYQIQYLQIFDMFPQTDHFETVALLRRI
jgi:23S rRNA (uracil1939-C5)-methyltransferase